MKKVQYLSVSNQQILEHFVFKTSAYRKVRISTNHITPSDRVENISDFQHFLLFQQCFQKAFPTVFYKPGIIRYRINPLLNRYSFRRINNRLLLKTFWEKEKLLVTSNFFFSHNVFNSIRQIVSVFVHIFDIISFLAVELEVPKIGILCIEFSCN